MRRALFVLVQIPAVLALLWLGQRFVELVQLRIAYPYDIEWMEGGMLVHALRAQQGLGLYIPPSADFIPYIYPPLYPWLIALLGEPSYTLGRGLSVFGTVMAMAAAVFAARREGAGWGLSLGAAGLYLSTFEDSGSFFDLVRADALAVGFASWALALCRLGSAPAVTAGGLLLVAAWLTKHNLALFGLPIALWLWRVHGLRRALSFGAASAGPALLITGALQWSTDGYFLTYLLGVPGSHPLVGERALSTITKELPLVLPYTNGAALALVVVGLATRRLGAGAAYWAGLVLTAAIACVLMRAHLGGFINVLMPGHWVLAAVGAAALGAAVKALNDHPAAAAVAALLLAFQVHEGVWNDKEDTRFRPTPKDVEAGDKVIAAIASVEGEVFAPQFPWYPHLAGKTPSVPLISLWDIDHKRGPLYEEPSVVEQAMAEQKWAAVLMGSKEIKHGVKLYYEPGPKISIPGGAFNTRTGWQVKPKELWLPIPQGRDEGPKAPASVDDGPAVPDEAPTQPEGEQIPAVPHDGPAVPDEAPPE